MARKSGPMAEADLRAFDPIPFPEVKPGFTFNVNFCRNPMCPNFGPAPDREAYRERYKVEPMPGYLADRRFRCLSCQMTTRLLSNRSLRSAYVWFKRQSIPFAACGDPGCSNEGVNVFEHSGRYGSKGRNKAKCKACGGEFSLGEAEHLRQWKKQKKRLAEIYGQLTDTNRGVSARARAIERQFKDPQFDVHRLQVATAALARRVRDYQSYCNAELMTSDYRDRFDSLFAEAGGTEGKLCSPFDGVATLSTDAMSVSLRSPGADFPRREHHLEAMLTALRIVRPDKPDPRSSRVFLLAAHPFWCRRRGKGPFPETPAEAVADAALPVADRQFDHLFHYGTDHSSNAWLKRKRQSYLAGTQGLYMRPEYANLAHFMVVKELTDRFDRVTLCMDGDRTNCRSALAIFAEAVQTPCGKDGALRRAEIAVVQTESEKKPNKSSRPKGKGWARERKRLANDWKRKLGEEESKGGGIPRAKAGLFRNVVKGGWSDEGGWGWLERPSWDDGRLIVMWLSQGPDRNWPPDRELDLFLQKVSLQSVDTSINAMRGRAAVLSRPGHRAEGGTSLKFVSENVEFAASGLWLSWLSFNYDNHFAAKEKRPQAPDLLGLLRPEDRRGSDVARRRFAVDRHLDFRLGWRHAVELTKRLGNG